jgi:hypothetical protein
MANGACCPEHAYYSWVGNVLNTNVWWGMSVSQCRCLDGYLWNGTACLLTFGKHMGIAAHAIALVPPASTYQLSCVVAVRHHPVF